MKKILTKIPKSYLILIVVLAFLVQTNITSAQSVAQSAANLFLGHSSLLELVYTLLAYLANTALTISSWLLIAAGSILDVSIRLTLNIKDFVDGTPAIFTVWKNLRDITGLFFIFFLLYAAIQMMTGLGKGPSYGTTIKNIVIAGILINFSFFIVSVAIDASNVVSQAIYNAMVPNKVLMKMDTKSNIAKLIESTPEKSRISNIFMNSLRIQSIYDTSGNRLKTNASDPVKIVLVGITGTIMMLTTAASFIFAAIAFIARLGILIFVLAFSSIWFAGTVIPQLGKETSKLVSVFTSQLLFMPVYLILMYVALSVISGSNFLLAGDVSNIVLPTGTNWTMPYIILGINFAIVIFLLNLPLAVGLSMGGIATGWMKNGMGKWDAMSVWKRFGGTVGVNTIGRTAAWADKKLGDSRYGNNLLTTSIRKNTVGALATSKYGGSQSVEDIKKASKERASKRAEVNRNIEFKDALKNALATGAIPGSAETLRQALKKKTTKEKLALGVDTLSDQKVVIHLSSGDLKAIEEEKEGLFSNEDKKKISDARYKALELASVGTSASPENKDIIKNIIGEMSGKELLKAKAGIFKNEDVIKNLKISQLKTMEEEGLDPLIKATIKSEIQALHLFGGHSAFGWVNKNW